MSARQRNLENVLAALLTNGIQVAIISHLPKCIDVHIGDEKRGPVGQKTVKPKDFLDLTDWFIETGRKHYPRSAFATIEWTQ